MTKITGSRVSSASQLTDPSKYLLLGQQGSLQIILRRATNLDSIPLNIDQNTYRLELILPGSIQPVTLSELQQILWSLLTELYTEGLSKVGSFFFSPSRLYSTLSLSLLLGRSRGYLCTIPSSAQQHFGVYFQPFIPLQRRQSGGSCYQSYDQTLELATVVITRNRCTGPRNCDYNH